MSGRDKGKGGRSDERPTAAAAAAAAAARLLREQESQKNKAAPPPAKRARITRGPNDVPSKTRVVDTTKVSVEQFERAVLGPMLWHRPEPGELAEIPTEFQSAAHYVKAFEPVLLEETREEVRSAWLESLGERRQYPLRLVGFDSMGGGGWRKATLMCDDRRDAESIRALCEQHSVAVLCERRIDEANPWPLAVAGHDLPLAVGVFVEQVTEKEGFVEVTFYVSNDVGTATDAGAPGWKPWHESLRQRERAILEAFEGVRRYTPGSAAEEGEYVRTQPQPPVQKAEGRLWVLTPAGKLSSAAQTYEALHHFRRLHGPMRAAMLRPPRDGMPKVRNAPPPPLAEEIENHPEFVDFLDKNFNEPQLAAIRWSAAHTLRDFQAEESSIPAELPTEPCSATAMGGVGGGTGGSGDFFPFTLVQGPPGTGKTHTVWGILNILHLVLYQRYYQHMHVAINIGTARATGDHSAAARAERDMNWLNAGAAEDEMQSETVRDLFDNLKHQAGVEPGHNYGVPKPRILVCAPSNAAIDNLLERVMFRGFQSLQNTVYHPNVIRVGAADVTVGDKVMSVYAGGKVEALMRMTPQEWNDAYLKQDRFVKEATACIAYHERQHLIEASNVVGAEGGPDQDPATKAANADRRVAEMLRLSDDRNKAVSDMARLAYLLTHLGGGRGDGKGNNNKNNKRENRQQHRSKMFRVRQALEASFVDEAEIVFTTLTSSSRRVFRQLTHGFDTVLIDEAAQANEVATLIPFLHGARRCVLVGDPQQLPSTVLSGAAQGVSFQRSLFERFTALGAEAMLLSVQYRMHPAIRAFPSKAFYESRLTDSASVTSAPSEPYHSEFPLAPYVLFDATGGSQRKSATGSLSNAVEALMVVCLFKQLEANFKSRGESVKDRCSVITPYRHQRETILRAFAALCGGDGAAARHGVRVSTIDGFQGQEADVIIVSTVRGGAVNAGQGVGFLADVRRMNVALTRAKRSLWVVGQVGALRRSVMWGKLVDDATARGCVVSAADSRELFSRVVPVEVQEQAMDQIIRGRGGVGFGRGGGGGGGGRGGGGGGRGSGGRGGQGQQRLGGYALPPPPPSLPRGGEGGGSMPAPGSNRGHGFGGGPDFVDVPPPPPPPPPPRDRVGEGKAAQQAAGGGGGGGGWGGQREGGFEGRGERYREDLNAALAEDI